MHRSKKLAPTLPIALVILTFTNSIWATVCVELLDKTNGEKHTIHIGQNSIRFENERETTIVRLTEQKVLKLNPSNHTYLERSFGTVDSIDRLYKKYNPDFETTDTRASEVASKVIYLRSLNLKNKPYRGAVIKFITAGRKISRTGIFEKSLSVLQRISKKSRIVSDILGKYLSPEEIQMLKLGVFPLQTAMNFEFTNILKKPQNQRLFQIPKGFKKRESGEYYKDFAVSLMSENAVTSDE